MSLPSFSARPLSAGQYVPESPAFRQHLYSDGPYKVSAYTPDKSVSFVRNPSWVASSDPLRKAYVDTISVTMGLSQDNIQQQLQGGSADMALGNEVPPTASVSTLRRANDPDLTLNPTGGVNPYVIFNLTSGGNPAIEKPAVRQALNYAVDKAAVVQVLGGPTIAKPFGQIFPSGVVGNGYKTLDPYATPNSAGDPAKAKAMLAAAGYPNGITLKFAYRNNGNNPKIFATLQASLAKAGVTLKGVEIASKQYYAHFLPTVSNATSDQWDLAEPGWGPDWEGAAERSFFEPLLDGRSTGSNNFGRYNDPAVNALADKALATADATSAAQQWTTIDTKIMADAPWIPLIENVQANYHAKRVRNFEWNFFSNQGDYSDAAVQ
jgi:peptide/nickel transport system substrate-binding protein